MGAEPSVRYHIDRIGDNYAVNTMFPDQRIELTDHEVRQIKLREAEEGTKFEDIVEAVLREKWRNKFA